MDLFRVPHAKVLRLEAEGKTPIKKKEGSGDRVMCIVYRRAIRSFEAARHVCMCHIDQ